MSNSELLACPFDETVEHELSFALDNYADDPDDNGALVRLANNCVTIGFEYANRTQLDELRAENERLKEMLLDWRNSWLCPVGHFDAERLLKSTDGLLGLSPIAGEYE